MRCQRCCPENRHLLTWFEDDVAFDEAETGQLMHCTAVGELAAETRTKLDRLGLSPFVPSLPRNLAVFLD